MNSKNKIKLYAKHEWALYTVLVYSKNRESNELEIQAYDYWLNDNKQNA